MDIDHKKLDKIIAWFNKGNLTSATIEYNTKGDYKIALSREPMVVPHTMHPLHDGVLPVNGDKKIGDNSSSGEKKVNLLTVESPIVGTLYRAPGPDSPPFVQVGDKVKKGEILCIIEAMKVMNELEADFDMEIVSIALDNAQLVEFGQVVFEVKAI